MLTPHPLWGRGFKGIWAWHEESHVRADLRQFWLPLWDLASWKVVGKVRDVDWEMVLPSDTLHRTIVLVQRGGKSAGEVCIGQVREGRACTFTEGELMWDRKRRCFWVSS